ncbi:Golgi complex component 7-domain-containing protein [Roridomyces roridus]|uniref:Conserved oligomeric Golgi complex subunit 7 n=1 Tax=Roridomyces roridus TaxID=1738132 RepID=A0AAD7CEW8_9AGAR|nr:Golgi complex component 7-domain-containing protein [Roridomyces roridus]
MASTTELISSLEESPDIVSWINDTLAAPDMGLTELDQNVNHLVSTLDLACEDTSSQLERIIDDVSRGVPRLTYDLHFMKDGATSLHSVLLQVTQRSREVIPPSTRAALDRLQLLDTVKSRMEAAREVLREAESWSTLELEVTSLLAEKSYAKAAERLSEASRSMAVFQNTPEYDPRKTLMVNLQNQLEAALSSALVAAINVHDLAACRNYFSIFSNIQRESEFRNYYNGSRRASVVALWQDTRVSDCDSEAESGSPTLAEFAPKFYSSFLALLNVERTSIPSIFPDPALTLSTLISSVLSALQPTFSQRLASIFSHYGDAALKELIPIPSVDGPPSHSRRRSTRLSMSWRTAPSRSTSSGLLASKSALSIPDDLEWEQELFQPFLDFQVEYGSLERRLLDHCLREIISSDPRDRIPSADRARLLRERADSMSRCTAFTHGYGAVGLSFIEMWTADVRMGETTSAPVSQVNMAEDLSDMDYTSEDWSDFQLSLHLLSSARAVFDRMVIFENKLRSSLVQIATTFKLARNDPTNFVIASSKGESQLLEQSSLNSAELHALLDRVEDPSHAHSKEALLPTAGLRHVLLVSAREGTSLQGTILSPLRKRLASYASSPLWTAAGDPKAKRAITANELHVPTFSLSPSLLNLPQLFEVYADDDALSFSLHTLPHVDPDQSTVGDGVTPPGHKRRQSLAAPKPPAPLDPGLVSSAWLSSLGHALLSYLTTTILPNIQTLSPAGAAQLSCDLGHLATIVGALNWKEYADLDDEEGKKRVAERGDDAILQHMSRMRGWSR